MKRKQFTKAERQEIWQKCNGHCAYCGCDLPYEKMQVDHIRSISTAEWNKIKTGVVEDINRMDNLLPACRSCNFYKREMGIEKFRDWMADIVNRLRYNSVTYQIAERYGVVQEVKWDRKFYFEKVKGVSEE